MAAKDSSGKNLVNLGQGDDFLGPETQFRPTLTTDYLTKLLWLKSHYEQNSVQHSVIGTDFHRVVVASVM